MALPTGSPVPLELRRRRGDGAAKIIHDVADGCARCVDLHVAGAVLVAARLAGFTALPWAVAALPFFAATGAAFAAQVRFLRTAAQLRLRPPAPDEFAYGTVSNGEGAIHEDALPLARRGACGVALSVPAAGVVLAAQLWALAGVLSVDGKRRNDRLARACLCILSLETVAVAASIVLRGRRGFSTDDRQNGGELGATLHCLSWLSLALGVRRLRASAAFPPAGAVDAFAPLWCAEALLVAALLHLYLRHRTGVYKLEKDQLAGALLYGVSCALAAGGQALFVRGHVQVAAVLLGLAAAAFGVPLRRALKRHASQLEASRGHEPPLPLRRDAAGHWTPTGARPSFWFLLGSFQRTRVDPPPPRVCANCAACACATTACTACAALPDEAGLAPGGVRTMTPLDAQTPPPLRPRADSGPMPPDA